MYKRYDFVFPYAAMITYLSLMQLFSLNVGDEYLPSTLPTRNGTLYWTISRASTSGNIFIKVRVDLDTIRLTPLIRNLRFLIP